MNTLSLVHDVLTHFVQPGYFCIDATAGKGRDTAFLCGLTGKSGRVLAFDIQREAVEQSRALLERDGWSETAQVICDSHANLRQYAPEGSVDCIVFNLGWLPGGDHTIYTHADSTIAAIEAGMALLRRGGLLCVSMYYGGASGYEERDALMEYWKTIDSQRCTVLVTQFANRTGDPPIPVFLTKDV